MFGFKDSLTGMMYDDRSLPSKENHLKSFIVRLCIMRLFLVTFVTDHQIQYVARLNKSIHSFFLFFRNVLSAAQESLSSL